MDDAQVLRLIERHLIMWLRTEGYAKENAGFAAVLDMIHLLRKVTSKENKNDTR